MSFILTHLSLPGIHSCQEEERHSNACDMESEFLIFNLEIWMIPFSVTAKHLFLDILFFQNLVLSKEVLLTELF